MRRDFEIVGIAVFLIIMVLQDRNKGGGNL